MPNHFVIHLGMSSSFKFRRRFRQVAGALLGCLLFIYFLFHTVHGERGLFVWLHLKQQIDQAKTLATELYNERLEWENRTKRLCCSDIDKDLLDERARIVAGLGNRNEFVIYYSPDSR